MSHHSFARVMGWAATVVVGTALVVAFWVVGSPMRARKESADRDRVSDLSSIAGSIRSYYQDKKTLPASLAEVQHRQDLDDVYKDPISGLPYEYSRIDKDHFSLCATFETDTTQSKDRDYYGSREFAKHPAGRYCFTLPTFSPYP